MGALNLRAGTKAMPLTDFLLARIAEDEAAARDALRDTHYPQFGRTAAEAVIGLAESEGGDGAGIIHFARHDPARVLAECEAKREIVEWHGEHLETAAHGRPCRTLRALALPYADHPDYREEWRA